MARATFGFFFKLRCLTRPIAVLMSTNLPSVSTQVGVTCGVPSGFTVATNTKFLPSSIFLALSVRFVKSTVTLPLGSLRGSYQFLRMDLGGRLVACCQEMLNTSDGHSCNSRIEPDTLALNEK